MPDYTVCRVARGTGILTLDTLPVTHVGEVAHSQKFALMSHQRPRLPY